MRQRILGMAVLVAVSAACASIVSVESTDGGGGASGGPTGVVLSTVGSGGSDCDLTYRCTEAITPAGDPTRFCWAERAAHFYKNLVDCACAGPCAAVCAMSACVRVPASEACMACIKADTAAGCGAEFQKCLADGSSGG